MKKIRIALLLIFLSIFSLIGLNQLNSLSKTLIEKVPKETSVYICNSEKAVAYHSSKTCRGLNNCKHEILEVSKTDAVNAYGRRACKICY